MRNLRKGFKYIIPKTCLTRKLDTLQQSDSVFTRKGICTVRTMSERCRNTEMPRMLRCMAPSIAGMHQLSSCGIAALITGGGFGHYVSIYPNPEPAERLADLRRARRLDPNPGGGIAGD